MWIRFVINSFLYYVAMWLSSIAVLQMYTTICFLVQNMSCLEAIMIIILLCCHVSDHCLLQQYYYCLLQQQSVQKCGLFTQRLAIQQLDSLYLEKAYQQYFVLCRCIKFSVQLATYYSSVLRLCSRLVSQLALSL